MDLMDRIFWGMVGFIGIHFALLAGLEDYVNFYAGSAFAFAFLIWFVWRGYRLIAGGDAKS
ncbi:hypothetical protein [Hoeflea prorocentri]|uniref:Uncharacterized protein n=1 Tax=Hoeflea prorocentri TaxID=1922333 RepID=A0A9X3UFG2_9HYPH|nr:hypothetical protein [Hoeflea prorocentri]MCY6379777.1 hypothetical protein [Hoeflea prorocentri]MDA5397577.1 hypothetical protein [Hoeflea prorocentri]